MEAGCYSLAIVMASGAAGRPAHIHFHVRDDDDVRETMDERLTYDANEYQMSNRNCHALQGSHTLIYRDLQNDRT